MTAQEINYSKEKAKACKEIMLIREKYFKDTNSVNAKEIEKLDSLLGKFYPDTTLSDYLPGYGNDVVLRTNPGDYMYKNLDLPGQEQDEEFNCGPAAAKAVLAGREIYVSFDDLEEDMYTTIDGTYLGNIAPALNLYNGVNGNWFNYAIMYGSTLSSWPMEFANATITTLLGNYGVVINGHQLANSSVYFAYYDGGTGLSQSEIGHYVAGEGFDSTDPSARILYYYDSIPSEDMFLPTRHVEISFQRMAILTNDRGLVY
ncbi:MAG: C39 family peptidase [Negativicutes bacterium]|nr:C39 family peptidase [Negativicutes bacterium]